MSPSGGEKLPVRDRSNVGRGQCSSLDDPIAGRHDAMLILLGPTGWLVMCTLWLFNIAENGPFIEAL
jgi:hypothetical protein